MSMTTLDSAQVIKSVYNDDGALRVQSVTGSLVTDDYDNLVMTYVPSGNGAGEVATVVYKLGSTTVATLTLAYNSDNKLSTVTKS